MSKGQGGRNQAGHTSFTGHSKKFEFFIRAELLEKECDIINLPFLKDHSDIMYRLHWKGAVAGAQRQARRLLQEIKMVVVTEII